MKFGQTLFKTDAVISCLYGSNTMFVVCYASFFVSIFTTDIVFAN